MLLKVWFYTLLLVKVSVLSIQVRPKACPNIQTPPSPPHVIKIGVILPFKGDYQWVIQAALPAIQLATETVENSSDILPGYKFVLTVADAACSDTIGPLAAIDMYINQSAHVFVGPACEYAIAPVARFSYYWGIPVLTAGALVSAFKDKNEYKLLTRVQGPLAKGSEFILDTIFPMFHWQTLVMIYGDVKGPNSGKRNCYFSTEAVLHHYQTKYQKRPPYADFEEDKIDVN